MALLGLLAGRGAAAEHASPELEGTSPGERAAIEDLCGTDRSQIAYHMCLVNQVIGLIRGGRKPDLSVAGARQQEIAAQCHGEEIPSDRFRCERQVLAAAGLPVRNEPGGGTLRADIAAATTTPEVAGVPRGETITAIPFYSLDTWRRERPAMPATKSGPPLSPSALYDRVWSSVFVVTASDQPLDLGPRATRAIGSAVAVSSHILLTNCHVVDGRPHIMLTQHGNNIPATLVYADPAGDRCFLEAKGFPLKPVGGVRRFEDLHVGEAVFSLGTPNGLELSFGEGMVAGLRQHEGERFVQNSAPSWHGSSGGGLFDSRGNLVGITTLGGTAAPNLNFAIAAEDFWP
jgi:S1-C subfamily serine protease